MLDVLKEISPTSSLWGISRLHSDLHAVQRDGKPPKIHGAMATVFPFPPYWVPAEAQVSSRTRSSP